MAKCVDILFLIPTYNRPHLLTDLLWDISMLTCTYKVLIYNDASTVSYEEVEKVIPYLHECNYYELKHNYGKQQFWKLQNIMYDQARCDEYKYCIGLLDDMRLVPDFYPQVINQFEQSRVDLLNIILPDCTKEYFEQERVSIIGVNGYTFYDYQWNDLCYITTQDYFDAMNYTCPEVHPYRWVKNKNASSGVSNAMTYKATDLGLKIMVVTKSLLTHTGQVSVMNTHRKGYISA